MHEGDRHSGEAEASGSDETLGATDDGAVFPAGEDRLDEPELTDAPFEGVEFLLADPTRVGGVRTKEVDRDLFDAYRGIEFHGWCLSTVHVKTCRRRRISRPAAHGERPGQFQELALIGGVDDVHMDPPSAPASSGRASTGW